MSALAAFVGSEGSKWAIIAASAGATAALVGTVAVLGGRREARLERRLAGYDRADVELAPVDGSAGSQTTGFRQAVDLTQRLAGRTSLLSRMETMLEQADLPLRAAEVIFYIPVFAIFGFLITAILLDWLFGIVVGVVVGLIPFMVIDRKRRMRLQAFDRLLPDTLTLIASSMRAGFSLMQALETVAKEIRDPMRRELQRVFTEVRLGRAVEDALAEVADRMKSRDLAWTVMAIQIQREVGGNLAALLDTVAETMTQRERLRREVHSLTAEGRLSAILLSAIPPLLGLFIFIANREYIETLFDDPIGILGLVGAGVGSVIGWFWLRKIVDIEA
ncbi:MAG: type II secretion system F family protein [Actinomycetota bacterium]